jgi:hypothetical protein
MAQAQLVAQAMASDREQERLERARRVVAAARLHAAQERALDDVLYVVAQLRAEGAEHAAEVPADELVARVAISRAPACEQLAIVRHGSTLSRSHDELGIISATPTNSAVMHRITRWSFVLLLIVPACGESPEAVCDHTLGLMKTVGAPALDRGECVADMAKTKERHNFIQWKRFSSCVVELESMDGMDKCTVLLR